MVQSTPFYLVRDGKPACMLVYAETPFSPEFYEEKSAPNAVRDTSFRLYRAVWNFVGAIKRMTGVSLDAGSLARAEKIAIPKIYAGRMDFTDYSLLGEATAYQYAIMPKDGDLYPLAHTPRGFLDALFQTLHSVVVSEDQKNAWIPPEAFRIYDREMPECVHAFPHFTVSIYGPPYIHMPNPAEWLADEKTFRDLLAFGVDEVPLYAWGKRSAQDVENIRALIRKFYEHGVTTRLYGVEIHAGDAELFRTRDYTALEKAVREFVETYEDLPGISQWGYCDEPEPYAIYDCAEAAKFFRKYDPKQRPVYINLGPRAHCRGVQNFYDRLAYEVPLDYFCLDRYPFLMTERGAEMADPYFYAHFELNRNYAVDYGRDCGMILASIKVGASPTYADISEAFLRYQTNLLLAYGCRYVERYVYYHVHDYCILGEDNTPTFRWQLTKDANDYLHSAARVLEDERLDAVFHLANEDGSYDIDVIPYYGYRCLGNIRGTDAVLSFYTNGILVVTDKRCDEWDGGEHEIVFPHLPYTTEWYDADDGTWKALAGCPAAQPIENGWTLTMSRASQYILRIPNSTV